MNMQHRLHLFQVEKQTKQRRETLKTFDELSDYAAHEGLHLEILDEQPVFNVAADDDLDYYVVVLLGDYIPGAAGTRDDMEEGEGFERREVWVSILTVEATPPMGAKFAQLDTDHQSWHELADMAESAALELMA